MADSHPHSSQPPLAAGNLILDLADRTLTGPARAVELQRGPFSILQALMQAPGSVVSLDQLAAARWCPGLEPENALVVIRCSITRVRDMIRTVGGDPDVVRSVRGEGYRFSAERQLVRAFTVSEAVLLDRLLATHPDRTAAAALSGHQVVL